MICWLIPNDPKWSRETSDQYPYQLNWSHGDNRMNVFFTISSWCFMCGTMWMKFLWKSCIFLTNGVFSDRKCGWPWIGNYPKCMIDDDMNSTLLWYDMAVRWQFDANIRYAGSNYWVRWSLKCCITTANNLAIANELHHCHCQPIW